MKALKKIIEYFRVCDLYFAVYFPVALGFSIILLGAFIGDKMQGGKLPMYLTYLMITISALISSFSGVVQITRKETPWLPNKPIRGVIPVLFGYVWVTFCWGIVLLEVSGLILFFLK